ncbi:primosomal protein N' [Sphaerochaeta sp. PS]|uniref:replication restart helicase PriA n=1 Tax=Sphaerochaeta sp. PS TaxID=3076336 RepID=UPI0028A555E4|nr:primosomal protein N' [Sphaerochaeta sp. PS]MDT4761214.1 primosomal protein N' [Sphaerochaeta sp. PS]
MSLFAHLVLDVPVKQSYTYAIPSDMEPFVHVGIRVVVPFGKREMTGYVIEVVPRFEATYPIREIKRVIDKESLYGEASVKLAYWMARFYLCSQGEALSMMVPGGRRDSSTPALAVEDDATIARVANLSVDQSRAIETILEARHPMYYLYGITGSGKSEVFLRCAEAMIAQGKAVIYLVPEITLTHQLARQVTTRFENKVAILHSALTPSQRLSQWKRIRSGEVLFAIGARSAVFAPFENLGMIIIDEEHENSYKSGNTPRYHARQVAQQRCKDEKALLVMGSATPSLEAWSMMKKGQVTALRLDTRVGGGVPPQVTVVDMVGEKHTLSKKLLEEMQRVLGRKKQVILFLNRRGYSYFFHCKSCGYDMQCPHCSVSLTFHHGSNDMVCHYCGYRGKPIQVCPECHSLDVGYSGFGTEMVEQEVSQFFPKATIRRLDTDSAKDKKHMQGVLDQFRKGEVDILLGTQMVAKGLNFPGVELVGIVLADSGMNIPDFRSQERTFSLLMQVSGRAGRYDDQGQVIIQTFHPDNSAVVHARLREVDAFFDQELAMREETGFPPHTRLINLVVRGRNKEKVIQQANRLEELLEASIASMPGEGAAEVLCNCECPLEKIASNWRHHVLVMGPGPSAAHSVVAHVLEHYTAPSGIYVEVDIDPLQML